LQRKITTLAGISALLPPVSQGASLPAARFFILLGQSSNAPNPFGCSFLLIDKRTNPTAKPFYQSIKIELFFSFN
jgi:hypothetical protein